MNKKIDYKHITYHIIIALYFLWLIIFITLLTITLVNIFNVLDSKVASTLTSLIIFNVLMGAALYLVFRLYNTTSRIARIINYTFITVMIITALTIAVSEFFT